MNGKNKYDEYSEKLVDEVERNTVPAENAPSVLLQNSVAYWLASPKARPYIKVQNDISVALHNEKLTEEQQRWLLDKDMEAAREAAQNIPTDKHPGLRLVLECGACCALGVTILCVGAACCLCQKK